MSASIIQDLTPRSFPMPHIQTRMPFLPSTSSLNHTNVHHSQARKKGDSALCVVLSLDVGFAMDVRCCGGTVIGLLCVLYCSCNCGSWHF